MFAANVGVLVPGGAVIATISLMALSYRRTGSRRMQLNQMCVGAAGFWFRSVKVAVKAYEQLAAAAGLYITQVHHAFTTALLRIKTVIEHALKSVETDAAVDSAIVLSTQ